MTKRFIKDNRGQVLYAVIVTVMFLGVLSMIAMGLTLQHYHASVQKQERVSDYYAADAAAELLRIDPSKIVSIEQEWNVDIGDPVTVQGATQYTINNDTVTLVVEIQNGEFTSWEVSYHAKQPAE
ncbi:MAG: hypothetical protein IJF08_09645 [Clostridia bacterium]|nr:hypothetical protein [Clostridia bacterium]